MLRWKRLAWALVIELTSGAVWAQSHHHHHCEGSGMGLGAVGGGGGSYPFPFYSSIGSNGLPYSYVPALPVFIPVAMVPGFGPALNAPPALRSRVGVAGPWPGDLMPPRMPAAREPAKPRRPDPTRSSQLVTFGDRHFRAGNLHRAAERYEQAMAADPDGAAPRVRLAQIAVVRGQYAEAANRYREAMTAQPGWVINAPDIQAIYGEPSEFSKQVAKLETHLQAHPNDRDAWLVLGAQWYLSGKSRKAADVFLRLSDRQGDATLAAFLDASTPRRPEPQ